jgi:hypothetical protein
MWCSTCQQDVPALGSPSDPTLRCGKCQQPLARAEAYAPDAAEFPTTTSASKSENAKLERLLRGSPLGNDDWAMDAELRGVQRLLTSLKSKSPLAGYKPAEQQRIVHAGHAPHSADHDFSPRSDEKPLLHDKPRSHAAAWAILSLGLAVFACGAVLLGWSLLMRRDDLWPIGMPLALIGQAGLIVGLVLQLDGLWHSNKQTASVLHELDGELKNVRQATTLLSSSHSSGAQSFYLHLAEGASPQMLLTDLKGQMDLLAQQMARQNK